MNNLIRFAIAIAAIAINLAFGDSLVVVSDSVYIEKDSIGNHVYSSCKNIKSYGNKLLKVGGATISNVSRAQAQMLDSSGHIIWNKSWSGINLIIDASNQYMLGNVSPVGEKAYFCIIKFDTSTGDTLWTRAIKDTVNLTGLYISQYGKFVVVCGANVFYCLDTLGSLLWSKTISASSAFNVQFTGCDAYMTSGPGNKFMTALNILDKNGRYNYDTAKVISFDSVGNSTLTNLWSGKKCRGIKNVSDISELKYQTALYDPWTIGLSGRSSIINREDSLIVQDLKAVPSTFGPQYLDWVLSGVKSGGKWRWIAKINTRLDSQWIYIDSSKRYSYTYATSLGSSNDIYIAGITNSIPTDWYLTHLRYEVPGTQVEVGQQRHLVNFSFYPNPFKTMAAVRLSARYPVKMSVVSVDGKLTKLGEFNAGQHEIQVNGNRMASGMYLLRVESNGKIESRKLQLIK